MALKPFNQEGSEPSSAGFQRQQRRQGPVPFTTKLAQGFSALPGQHKDWAFNTLLLLYYSQVLGLSASLAALAIAASLLIDAITDPMVGAFSDSFRSRLGRRHGLMLASILPTCGAMFALFSPPETLQDGGLAAWMLACSIVLRISFTFFAVPWGAIAAELSEDYAERTTIIAYRMLIGGLGGVIFIFFIYALFPASDAYVNGLFNPASYPRFAAVIATLMAFWMLLSTLATLDQIKFLPQPNQAVARPNPGDMIHRVYAALANKNFRVLFVATLIAAAVVGTGQVFDTYMNTFFLLCTRPTKSADNPLETRMRRSGCCWRIAFNEGGRTPDNNVGTEPISKLPASASPATKSLRLSHCSMISRARSTRLRPRVFNRGGRVVRSKSLVSKSSSNALTCKLIAD